MLVILSPQSHRRHKTTSQPNNQRCKISSPTKSPAQQNNQRNQNHQSNKTTSATKPPARQNHQHDKITSTAKYPEQKYQQRNKHQQSRSTSAVFFCGGLVIFHHLRCQAGLRKLLFHAALPWCTCNFLSASAFRCTVCMMRDLVWHDF